MTDAPGCFGSVISHDKTDPHCQKCAHMASCGQTAFERLRQMQQEIDVSDYIRDYIGEKTTSAPSKDMADKSSVTKGARRARRRRTTVALTPEQYALVSDPRWPKKGKELLESLFRRGITRETFLNAFKRGVNPFVNSTPRTLRVACDLLLAGGFSRAQLAKEFVRGGMKIGTAYAQVAIVVSVLQMLELVDENSSRKLVITKES